MKDESIKNWKKRHGHLPYFLKDFHAQKELFLFLQETSGIEKEPIYKDLNVVMAHCYTIDVFLHILATYGYTLQKNKSKKNFRNIDDDLKEFMDNRKSLFGQILLNASNKKGDENAN